MRNNNKMQGKDLINVGIYTAIYFFVTFLIAMLGYIPIFLPLLSVIVPVLGGIPFMLFLTKVKKPGTLLSHIPPRLMAVVIRRGRKSLLSGQKRLREFESIYQKRKSIFFVPT